MFLFKNRIERFKKRLQKTADRKLSPLKRRSRSIVQTDTSLYRDAAGVLQVVRWAKRTKTSEASYLQLGVGGRCKPPNGVQGRSPGKFYRIWGTERLWDGIWGNLFYHFHHYKSFKIPPLFQIAIQVVCYFRLIWPGNTFAGRRWFVTYRRWCSVRFASFKHVANVLRVLSGSPLQFILVSTHDKNKACE